MTTEARLGPALRALRRRLNLTLNEVAKKTGVTASTLSKAERNRLSLTYDKLVQIARGLDVDITVFFDSDSVGGTAPGSGSRRSINRESDGRAVDTRNYRNNYLSIDLLRKKFIPILTDIKAKSLDQFGELIRHPGEEFAFVVHGTIVVHTEHYAPVILKAGESMYFDSGMGHAYIAQGEGPSRILSICSAPESSLMEALTSVPASPPRSMETIDVKRPKPHGKQSVASKSKISPGTRHRQPR
jgi:transcriptional regulator with XRE-family HTH domain